MKSITTTLLVLSCFQAAHAATLLGGTDFTLTSSTLQPTTNSALTAFANPSSTADGVGLASGGPGFVFDLTVTNPAIFIYTFNSSVDIDTFSLNSLVGGAVDNGVQNFTLTLLNSSGSTIASLSDSASLVGTRQDFAISASNVSSARLEVTTSHGSSPVTELSEVAFEGELVPEPSSSMLLGLAGLGLVIRRSRTKC